MTTERQLDAHDVRRVAVEAMCDDRTVKRYLAGKGQAALVRRRIEAALRKLGFEGAVRAEAAS